MLYRKFKLNLSKLNLSINDFCKIENISLATPTKWKQKNEVPTYVKNIIELLEMLPLEQRLVWIHNKLEEYKKS
jgi:hypothetical protein